MKLDRELQKQFLEKLADAYPEFVDFTPSRIIGDPTTINLWYLGEHGLIETIKDDSAIGRPAIVLSARITYRGLDFLADDGGMSAILGVVTVKFHADTIRDLIEARIANADIPDAEKQRFIDHVRALPGEMLKTATTHLLEQALDHLPDAIPLLRTLLGF